ncbi:3-deoxy-manno-octulosonate cytidylyltransferase [Aquimarina agarivorans]|uniref:3-deoxy-manno-octulosonate cytidylyltransferase n=1 Tax=Aquimarina agarivorans TaxID=980584 RepID=UPI0002E72160|nr:3-deoxy-manno-octulosonate cytidylyltransferase [Aquimarina agarivorans]
MMKKIIVIPARLKSSRLANKLLLDLGGKSIIQRVYEQCLKAKNIDAIYIAVDENELKEHCSLFCNNVIMTDTNHQSGTDRIAEAISNIDCDAVINVQGDEPFIDPNLIETIANCLDSEEMVSAKCKLEKLDDIKNPNNVKVITDCNSKAIYFSRAAIPFNRDGVDVEKIDYFKHLGIYGYSKKFLIKYAQMKPTRLEITEKLEQLRVIENGFSIHMVQTTHNAIGIDTLEDYNEAQQHFL